MAKVSALDKAIMAVEEEIEILQRVKVRMLAERKSKPVPARRPRIGMAADAEPRPAARQPLE